MYLISPLVMYLFIPVLFCFYGDSRDEEGEEEEEEAGSLAGVV